MYLQYVALIWNDMDEIWLSNTINMHDSFVIIFSNSTWTSIWVFWLQSAIQKKYASIKEQSIVGTVQEQ